MSFTIHLRPRLSLVDPPNQIPGDQSTAIWQALKSDSPLREDYEYSAIPNKDCSINVHVLGHGTISVVISPSFDTAEHILQKINSQYSIKTDGRLIVTTDLEKGDRMLPLDKPVGKFGIFGSHSQLVCSIYSPVKLTFMTLTGKVVHNFVVHSAYTVHMIKVLLWEIYRYGPPDLVFLHYSGHRLWQEDATLVDHNVLEGSTVIIGFRLAGGFSLGSDDFKITNTTPRLATVENVWTPTPNAAPKMQGFQQLNVDLNPGDVIALLGDIGDDWYAGFPLKAPGKYMFPKTVTSCVRTYWNLHWPLAKLTEQAVDSKPKRGLRRGKSKQSSNPTPQMPILSPPIDRLLDFIDDMEKLSRNQMVTLAFFEIESELEAKHFKMDVECHLTLCQLAKVTSASLWVQIDGQNLLLVERSNSTGELNISFSVSPSSSGEAVGVAEKAPNTVVEADWTLKEREMFLEKHTFWLTMTGRPIGVRVYLVLRASWSSGTQSGEWMLTSTKPRVFGRSSCITWPGEPPDIVNNVNPPLRSGFGLGWVTSTNRKVFSLAVPVEFGTPSSEHRLA